jgi:hypothetical protein
MGGAYIAVDVFRPIVAVLPYTYSADIPLIGLL